MLRSSVAAAALAVVFAATSAQAADLPRRTEPRAPVVSSMPMMALWTGPYVGFNLGYGFGKSTGVLSTVDPDGFVMGLQAGYNHQWDMYVAGIEGDINYSFMHDSNAAQRADINWYGTIRPRLGVAIDRALVYVTGGLAFGDHEGRVGAAKQAKNLVGWTAGAGVEYAFTNNVSGKLEYLYMDLANTNYGTLGGKSGNDSHLVRAGLNYKFSM